MSERIRDKTTSEDTAHRQALRSRSLGVPCKGKRGPLNAITDIAGVEVGHATLIRGEPGALAENEGLVRTGITAILPRGRSFDPVFAAIHALNGNGEMTGTHWIEESGFLETPILITNTFSVGVVRDAVLAWMDREGLNPAPDGGRWFALPVVAETYDALNDIRGQHVTRQDAFDALDAARGGPVAEGNVGGGTGMIAHGFKGEIGTSSRRTKGGHTLGVLVQANHGDRERFTVAGVPIGREIPDLLPSREPPGDRSLEEACVDRGIEVGAIVREIEEELARAVDPEASVDWSSATSAELIAHIVKVYHEPLHAELPRLVSLARKVAAVHGPRRRFLPVLSQVVRALSEDLHGHMMEEEEAVFTAILDGSQDDEALDALKHDHDEAGAALDTIRELTGDYAAPPDACGTWRALWSGLEEFERTLQQHVHLQNNVLFPRATG